MQIESIHLKNFKVFQNVTVRNLKPFSVFIGANGVGKSTFFDVFGFLRDCLKDNARIAVQKRGGYRELVSRGHENESISIEIKARVPISERYLRVTYLVEIGEQGKNITVKRERLSYKRGSYGAPYLFLDFANGAGQAISNEENLADNEAKKEYQELGSADILALKGLGQFQRFIAASAIRSLVENWHVSDFKISAARPSQDQGYAEHLSTKGENLPLVTQFLFQNHPEIFSQILEALKRRIPGVTHVEAAESVDGRVVLRFQDGSFRDPFIGRFVSDGTIKMFAYLVLLYDPKPHPLLCIEEPENQLYPTLLHELAEEFHIYSSRQDSSQVFVSTHSPDFLDAIAPENTFMIKKTGGFSSIIPADEVENVSAFFNAGEKLGQLWRQGVFEEIDPK